MKKIVSQCPMCTNTLFISAMQCPECGMELRNHFELSVFERLSAEQYMFLITFLRHRGNLKNLQSEIGLTYPAAKKKLDELLIALELADEDVSENEWECIDVKTWHINKNSNLASEIIKAKLKECGGRAIVHTARGLPCEIVATVDGKSFVSDKLPIKPPYTYEVFDVIVELLLKQNGRARKGNGRNYKMGESECNETTVVGAVAKYYSGKKDGESVFDPVFVFAAVLEWAGIAHNERGEIVLTQNYRGML